MWLCMTMSGPWVSASGSTVCMRMLACNAGYMWVTTHDMTMHVSMSTYVCVFHVPPDIDQTWSERCGLRACAWANKAMDLHVRVWPWVSLCGRARRHACVVFVLPCVYRNSVNRRCAEGPECIILLCSPRPRPQMNAGTPVFTVGIHVCKGRVARRTRVCVTRGLWIAKCMPDAPL